MTRKRDCLEVTLKVRVPLNAGDTASWAAALKAIENMAHVLPSGSVVESGMPKFGKVAIEAPKPATNGDGIVVSITAPRPTMTDQITVNAEPELPESLRR